MVFIIYIDRANEWRWRLRAGNGAIIATSGEGYSREVDCRHGIKLVRGASSAPIQKQG